MYTKRYLSDEIRAVSRTGDIICNRPLDLMLRRKTRTFCDRESIVNDVLSPSSLENPNNDSDEKIERTVCLTKTYKGSKPASSRQ